MATSKKVLVIAEGPDDKKVINRVFAAYGKNIEVVTFKTDVYKLFSIYEKQETDYSDLDIQKTLLNEVGSLTPNERKILQDKYVDIFLIFDFDPHAETADIKKLKKLATHFKDSSDMGKLYINYPMLESFQHVSRDKLKAGKVDREFFERTFSEDDFSKEGTKKVKYKRRAKSEGFSHCDLSKDEWDLLVSHHLFKIEDSVGSLRKSDFSQEIYLDLLDRQDQSYKKKKYGMVVNTSLTIIAELYPKDWEDKTDVGLEKWTSRFVKERRKRSTCCQLSFVS